jgi:hypothetical protein
MDDPFHPVFLACPPRFKNKKERLGPTQPIISHTHKSEPLEVSPSGQPDHVNPCATRLRTPCRAPSLCVRLPSHAGSRLRIAPQRPIHPPSPPGNSSSSWPLPVCPHFRNLRPAKRQPPQEIHHHPPKLRCIRSVTYRPSTPSLQTW